MLTGEESSQLPGESPGSCLIVVSSCRGSSARLGRVDFNGREPAEPAVIMQRCSGTAQNTWNNGQRLADRDMVVNPEILWTSEGETPEQESRGHGERLIWSRGKEQVRAAAAKHHKKGRKQVLLIKRLDTPSVSAVDDNTRALLMWHPDQEGCKCLFFYCYKSLLEIKRRFGWEQTQLK